MTEYVRCPMRWQHEHALAHCYCCRCRGTDEVPAGFAIELVLLGLADLNPDAKSVAHRCFVYELKLRYRQRTEYMPSYHTLEYLEERYPRP